MVFTKKKGQGGDGGASAQPRADGGVHPGSTNAEANEHLRREGVRLYMKGVDSMLQGVCIWCLVKRYPTGGNRGFREHIVDHIDDGLEVIDAQKRGAPRPSEAPGKTRGGPENREV